MSHNDTLDSSENKHPDTNRSARIELPLPKRSVRSEAPAPLDFDELEPPPSVLPFRDGAPETGLSVRELGFAEFAVGWATIRVLGMQVGQEDLLQPFPLH